MKALIIEDEQPAAKRLIRLINEIAPEISVIGQIDSVEESVKWFNQHDMPDIVFLDIHLSDGYSFNIFKQVEITAPIIFTTAYDEYALEAFKVNSIDYLLKPIGAENLKKSILKLKNLQAPNIKEIMHNLDRYIQQSKESLTFKTRFLIRQKKRLMTVEDSQVAYFLANNKMVILVTFENRQFVMDETLESYEAQVNPDLFFRLNRSLLTSRSAIKDILTHYNGKLKIELNPPLKDETFVSRERTPAFKKWLES
jgi:DNA-binding LytR/AlgR family response regulator